jgi:hypothetical protein
VVRMGRFIAACTTCRRELGVLGLWREHQLLTVTTKFLKISLAVHRTDQPAVNVFTSVHLTLGKLCHLNGQTTDNQICLINSSTNIVSSLFTSGTHHIALLSILAIWTVEVQDMECRVLCIAIHRLAQRVLSQVMPFTTPTPRPKFPWLLYNHTTSIQHSSVLV